MTQKALEVTNLTKKYWEKTIINTISFDIEKWDFYALLWHNWAGKTTIIWILTDLVAKNSGKVKIFWTNIDTDFAQAKSYIWVVPQEFNVHMWTVIKHIPVIQAGYYGIKKDKAIKRTEKLFKALGLWEHKDKAFRQLSWWMKRRLMIARALVHKPKFLILDEPTAWVDVELRKTMWDFIRKLNQEGTTILLTTHYLEEVESLCNKVMILNQGKIVKNTSTTELLSTLSKETFILDIIKSEWNTESIESHFQDFQLIYISDIQIEITISKQHTLNILFEKLSQHNIQVQSMRNKTNRIEQLFTNLTQ